MIYEIVGPAIEVKGCRWTDRHRGGESVRVTPGRRLCNSADGVSLLPHRQVQSKQNILGKMSAAYYVCERRILRTMY